MDLTALSRSGGRSSPRGGGSPGSQDVLYWILWAVVIIGYVAWPLTHLDAYAWSNDEGLYVQRAALANEGFRLYEDIAFNKPPLLVWILRLAFRLFGRTLPAARMACLALSLIGFVTFGALVALLWGRWAGLLAAGLLLSLPEIPVRAHAVMSDWPALTFALVALAGALVFRRRGRRSWLVLSALAFAASMSIHPFLIYLALPLMAILLIPGIAGEGHRTSRTSLLDLLLFCAVGIAAGLLVFAFVKQHAFVEWVVRSNVSGLDAEVIVAETGMELLGMYLGDHLALVGLAALGLVALLSKGGAWPRIWLHLIWALSTIVVFSLWSPIWSHYLFLITFPLIGLAASGIRSILGAWLGAEGDFGLGRSWLHNLLGILLIGSSLVYGIERWGAEAPQLEGGPEWSSVRLEGVEFLRENAAPDEFVATDDLLIAFVAERLVPPALTETTLRHVITGQLTDEEVVLSLLRHNVSTMLFATGRMNRYLPYFRLWVESLAVEAHTFGLGGGKWLVRGLRFPALPPPPDQPMAIFDDTILLQGVQHSSVDLQDGQGVKVVLYWEAQGPIELDYSAYLQLVDDEGNVLGECYDATLKGALRSSRWPEDILLPDPHTITIAEDVSPGRYQVTLKAGLCLSEQECAPVVQGQAEQGALVELDTFTLVVP